MARQAPLLCAWVFLLTSAPCRGDRRQQDLVELLSASVAEENGTGVASVVVSSKHAANGTASQATKGVAKQAASSSATRTASSSARSAANASAVVVADVTAKARVRQGRSTHQRDQPSEHSSSSASQRGESGDVLASNLTAATVQAHAALAHAVSALAEQQARKTLELKNESESKSSAEGETKEGETKEGETKEGETAETEKLQEEEKKDLSGGLGNLAMAMSDPRKFLMGLDTIKTFSAAMRAAIEHGGEGKCLATGEFAGYGCGDDKDMPKICSCRHMYELCWLPDDPNKVVKNFPGQAALDEAKALLFGKCYTSYLLIAAIGIGSLLVLAVVAYCLKGIFKKKTPS